jgi:hypothetical protein
MQIQMKQMDAQVQANKERAQAEADVIVDDKRLKSDMMLEGQKIDYQKERDERDAALKELDMLNKREIEMIKLGLQENTEIGSILNREEQRNEVVSNSISDMHNMLNEVIKRIEAPKRLIRDENGDIIGSEYVREGVN